MCLGKLGEILFFDSEELCQRTACYKQYSKTLSSSHLSVSLYVLRAKCWLRPRPCGCYRKPCTQEQHCIWVWAVLSGSRTSLTHRNTSRNLLFGCVCLWGGFQLVYLLYIWMLSCKQWKHWGTCPWRLTDKQRLTLAALQG